MVEDQGFLHHPEFLNPWCAVSSQHYITLIPLSSHNVPTSFVEPVKQAIEKMLNVCEIDKQRVDVILHDSVRNMKKAMDDMEI